MSNENVYLKKSISGVKNWLIQGGVITPHLNHFPVYCITKELEDLQKNIGLNFILTFHQKQGDLSNWVFDEDYMVNKGRYLEQHPQVVNRLFGLWQKRVKIYYDCIRRLEKKGIKNFPKDYNEFVKKYKAEYLPAMLTEYFTVWSDVIYKRILAKVPKKFYKDIERIVRPYKKTFLNEEEGGELKIGLLLLDICQKKNVPLSKLKIDYIKKKFPLIFDKLQEHQKKFYWIQGNYKYTDPVTTEHFFQYIKRSVKHISAPDIKKKIKTLKNYEIDFRSEKRIILNKLKLSKKDISSLDLVSKIGWLHDMRKRANIVGNYWVNRFLNQASKILKVPRLFLQFTVYDELLSILKGGGPSREELKQRIKGCVSYYDKNGRVIFVVGKDFQKLKREILEKNILTDIKDFRGTSASYGRVRGRVKIITNPLKQKFPANHILVAAMTRPDYVPLMRKALAVVTDEGGITSHAAIVSREFGIPCIVGTKIATKVLKDNDLVEVSAVHGVVRIIK